MTLLNEDGEDVREVPRPLDHVSYDGNAIRLDGSGASNEYAEAGEEAKAEIRERVAGKYDPEKFHRHICGVLSWFGRRADFESLQIGTDDQDFENACNVIHRRAVVGLADRVLERISGQAAEDIIVVGVGLAPVAMGVIEEAREKRLAKKAKAQSGDRENDGSEKHD